MFCHLVTQCRPFFSPPPIPPTPRCVVVKMCVCNCFWVCGGSTLKLDDCQLQLQLAALMSVPISTERRAIKPGELPSKKGLVQVWVGEKCPKVEWRHSCSLSGRFPDDRRHCFLGPWDCLKMATSNQKGWHLVQFGARALEPFSYVPKK